MRGLKRRPSRRASLPSRSFRTRTKGVTNPFRPCHTRVGLKRGLAMIPSLAVTAALLVQASGIHHPARLAGAPDPVRISRTDSIVYVTLREPGNLVLLQVDPIGRINRSEERRVGKECRYRWATDD